MLLSVLLEIAGCENTPEQELAAYQEDLLAHEQFLVRAAAGLRNRRDADSLAAASLFVFRSDPTNALRLMEQARSAAPDRPELTLLHARICGEAVACDPRSIEARLRDQDPGNGIAWFGGISRAYEARDDDALDVAIGAAGRSRQINSYFTTLVARLSEAAVAAGTAPLLDAITAVSGEVAAYAIPRLVPEFKGCAVERLQRPELLDSCRALAESLMAGDTVIVEMIGVAIAKRVWPVDSPNWRTAVEARRVYSYRREAIREIDSDGDWDEADAADNLNFYKVHRREQDAMVAQLVSHDVDPTPPANWREPEKP